MELTDARHELAKMFSLYRKLRNDDVVSVYVRGWTMGFAEGAQVDTETYRQTVRINQAFSRRRWGF